MLALTFDDGPGPSTLELLDVLAELGVRATFFVIGRHLAEPPWTSERGLGRAIVKRALREGHAIGNHTLTHQHPRARQAEKEFVAEVVATDALIRELHDELGLRFTTPPLRLPFGLQAGDPRSAFIGALGRAHVGWSEDFDDWSEATDGAELRERLISYVAARESSALSSVLDLHDGGIGEPGGYRRPGTVVAVRGLLAAAATRGWELFQVPR